MLKPEFLEFDLKLLNGLSLSGDIIEVNGYCSLGVDTEFLLRSFAIIRDLGYELPSHPAHISVVYPEEVSGNIFPPINTISFTISGFGKMLLNEKIYLALIVDSKPLSTYRQNLGLSPFPFFKGVEVPFHITVAKKLLE